MKHSDSSSNAETKERLRESFNIQISRFSRDTMVTYQQVYIILDDQLAPADWQIWLKCPALKTMKCLGTIWEIVEKVKWGLQQPHFDGGPNMVEICCNMMNLLIEVAQRAKTMSNCQKPGRNYYHRICWYAMNSYGFTCHVSKPLISSSHTGSSVNNTPKVTRVIKKTLY